MERLLPSCRAIIKSGKFKQAMWELCKERRISFEQAEKALGFEDGFIESVERGIHKLTLEEVRKIANYFHTTMEAVLDGGHTECRISLSSFDELGICQEKDCIKAYLSLLESKAMNYWKTDLFVERVNENKRELEQCEFAYLKHHKAYMDKMEAENRAREMAECEDDVLVKELLRRGYKVEKDGN